MNDVPAREVVHVAEIAVGSATGLAGAECRKDAKVREKSPRPNRSSAMKLILFDIDGTLVHVRRDVLVGVLGDVVRHGTGHAEGVEGIELHGKTDRQIMLEICAAAGVDAAEAHDRCTMMTDRLLEAWTHVLDAETVEVLPGVAGLLEHLASRDDVRLGLLTGNLEPAARMKLAPHDLNRYFAVGAYGSDAIDRADLPPIALARASALDGRAFTAAETLIIGDSHRDIACAHASGIRALAVATGSLTIDDLLAHNPDGICASLEDHEYVFEFLAGE